jgi:glycosyltransferase involved in cell wall biosynthesis
MTLNFTKRLSHRFRHHSPSDPILDVDFYRDYYTDLVQLDAATLHKHWRNFGQSEGRQPNLLALLKAHGIHSVDALKFDLDLDFYLNFYPDLKTNGICNLIQAKIHWLTNGQKELRLRTLNEWKEMYSEESVFDISQIDVFTILEHNPSITINEIAKTLSGELTRTIQFADNNLDNADFYADLSRRFLARSQQGNSTGSTINAPKRTSQQWYQSALAAARIAYNLHPNSNYLELIGEIHLANGDFNTSTQVFHELESRNLVKSRLFYFHYIKTLLKSQQPDKALELCDKALTLTPEATFLWELHDECVIAYYYANAGKVQLLANMDERQALQSHCTQYSQRIYNSYFRRFHIGSTDKHRAINPNRILMIADFHVPQCVRYRVDQKVAQLKSQNIAVTTIDWTTLESHSNIIALYDLVIFYRVPSTPAVIKAMAQTNATGRYSFYEIDDLLFDVAYPAPMSTYGNYVDIGTHIELRKSMGSFYAAAQLCQFGIGSTKPLCEKLNELVLSKQSILHRNGLDKENTLRTHKKVKNNNNITIFYGSGTQAHNSDFIEQALPALDRILTKYKHVKLVIAGYLQLPKSFEQRHCEQLSLMPPVKNVKAYWQYLEQADINLAVLNDDEINGCKSELKWFEAACFKIPSIVSTTQNYRDVLTHGTDALIAGSEIEWLNGLESLIQDEALRETIAAQAQTKIIKQYSIEHLGLSLATQLTELTTPKTIKPKKKIALVNVFFPPQSIGGATRVVADNFEVLKEQYGDDFEIVVFTSDERCTTPYQLTSYQYQDTLVYRSTILYREHMDWHPKDPDMYTLFNEFLETEHPDLIHFHCVQRLTASIVEAAKDAGIPYMITAHDAWWISDHQFLVDQHGKVYPDGHPDIFAPRTLPHNVTLSDSLERLAYFRELLEGATHLVTVSESFAELYRKNGYPQIKVTKNGISAKTDWQAKQTSYTERVVCAHIGGMSEHKGYYLLKEAIEQSQPHNIEMLIVDHSKPDGWEKLTHWGKVPVKFIGRVAQKDIVGLYRQIDVLFAPSTWPESYGLVTREAAACGCWVVASDMGGIGEDVIEGENGLKISPSINNLHSAIKKINHKIKQFKSNCHQQGVRNVDIQVKDLAEIYNED